MSRLDIELVNRKLIETRAKAQEAIKNKLIYCNDICITKNSYQVNENDILTIKGELLKYVSKGGLKLEKAISTFNIDLHGKTLCDIGSSTGGFSDCALQNGISKIYAIDVGSNQFDSKLKENTEINLYENTDFRNINENLIQDTTIISIDVSFISVTKLIDKIEQLHNCKEIICLIKPQFECGKEIADKYKGIILNKAVHFDVINKLISAFSNINYRIQGLTPSPIKGGSGNIEYLMYLTNSQNPQNINIHEIINSAFKNK